MATLSSLASIVPDPSVSKRSKASRISCFCSSVSSNCHGDAARDAGIALADDAFPTYPAMAACVRQAVGDYLYQSGDALIPKIDDVFKHEADPFISKNELGDAILKVRFDRFDAALQAVVALFCGVIAIARSPSSAIAVVSEARSDGPFTQTVLGVTMVTDVAVIVLFGGAVELAPRAAHVQHGGADAADGARAHTVLPQARWLEFLKWQARQT